MKTRLSQIVLTLFSLTLIPIGSLTASIPAHSATPVTIFDGTYQGYEVISVTVTIPTNPPTKKTITSTTPTFYFTVVNGKIAGGVSGLVLNKSGTGTLTIPIAGYGSLTITIHFTRNSTTNDVKVTGTINGKFPAANTVVGGKFYGDLVDKLKFVVPSSITPAKIGKRYAGYSFCVPKTVAGRGCGWPAKSSNPSEGKPPYTFGWRVGSDLLPTGLVLNFKSGQILGTPNKALKPRTYRLIICAYDSAGSMLSGVCRPTNLVLSR